MNLAESRSHIPLVHFKKIKAKKKPIRKVSKKRSRVNQEYLKRRDIFLRNNRFCQYWLLQHGLRDEEQLRQRGLMVYSRAPLATEIHHVRGRGKYLLDESTWMAVSIEGHRAIHSDPKTSYLKGYMMSRR